MPLAPVVVVREHAGVEVAERELHRAGERREVERRASRPRARAYQSASASTSRPSASVFMISIVLPFAARRMSPGRNASPPSEVLGGGDDGDDAHRQPELGDRADAGDDRGAAGHVALHVLHLRRRLERDPAGVERDRLADETERRRRLRAPGGLVAQDDQPRLVRARRGRPPRARPCRARRSPPGRAPRRSGRSAPASSAARSASACRRRARSAASSRGRGPRSTQSATRLARSARRPRPPRSGPPGRPARSSRAASLVFHRPGPIRAEDDPLDDRARLNVLRSGRSDGSSEPSDRTRRRAQRHARPPPPPCGSESASPVARPRPRRRPVPPSTSPFRCRTTVARARRSARAPLEPRPDPLVEARHDRWVHDRDAEYVDVKVSGLGGTHLHLHRGRRMLPRSTLAPSSIKDFFDGLEARADPAKTAGMSNSVPLRHRGRRTVEGRRPRRQPLRVRRRRRRRRDDHGLLGRLREDRRRRHEPHEGLHERQAQDQGRHGRGDEAPEALLSPIDPLERWQPLGDEPDYAGCSRSEQRRSRDATSSRLRRRDRRGADRRPRLRPSGHPLRPRAIRAASCPPGPHLEAKVDAFRELRIVDYGDAPVVPADPERSHAAIEPTVGEVVDAGVLPVVLGGDHSITEPDVRAVAAPRCGRPRCASTRRGHRQRGVRRRALARDADVPPRRGRARRPGALRPDRPPRLLAHREGIRLAGRARDHVVLHTRRARPGIRAVVERGARTARRRRRCTSRSTSTCSTRRSRPAPGRPSPAE